MAAKSAGASAGDATVPAVQTVAAESSRVVFPLPEGTWTATDPYGPRTHPITGEQSFHTGSDFAAPDGTPLLAAADGAVTVAEFSGGYGGLIVIEHTIGGSIIQRLLSGAPGKDGDDALEDRGGQLAFFEDRESHLTETLAMRLRREGWRLSLGMRPPAPGAAPEAPEGVAPGDKVGVMLARTPQAIFAQLAVLLAGAVYGLTEMARPKLADARLVACPGCFPTAALLTLLPVAEAGLIRAHNITINALTGVSGAGRGLKEQNLFAEVAEAAAPYGIGRHRHMPEMEQELGKAFGEAVAVSFTPHLLPMNRGELLALLADPAWQPYVVFPACEKAPDRLTGEVVLAPGKKPLFILPQGKPVPGAEEVRFPTADGLTLQGCYLRGRRPRRGRSRGRPCRPPSRSWS